MFDALTHLYRCPDPGAVLTAGRAAGVHDVLLAGVDPAGWRLQSALAGPGVHVAYGCHPWTARGSQDASLLSEALSTLVPPVAIGEIGLDGSGAHRENLAAQEASLLAQLDLARQRELPVILHIVRAHGTAMACFDRCPAPPGIVHGFSGSLEVAEQWIRRGFLLGFGHLVCDGRAKRAQIAATRIGLDTLVVESDSPSHFPGPAGITRVIASLAVLRGEAPEVIAAASARNARRALRLPP
jgi:TatD DNase family protein